MITAETLTKAEQAQLEWEAWQQAKAERRAAKGYDVPVSDEEALEVLG